MVLPSLVWYTPQIMVHGKAPLLEDNVAILNVPGLPGVNEGWTDSYSDGDSCYCATTFDHDIGTIVVDTPLGKKTVREVCELLGNGPTGSSAGRPLYNDIQCGNGPANNAGDETTCPGRTEHGQQGCKYIGPKWNFNPFLSPTTPVSPPRPVAPPKAAPVAPTKAAPVVPPTLVLDDCTITFDLFNALTDMKVATLKNGDSITNPPPCGQANIQAVVSCSDSDGKVTIELYQSSKKIHKSTDSEKPYFLFGNKGSDVKKGKIKPGTYGIRAEVNGVWSDFTYFTLGGTCTKRVL